MSDARLRNPNKTRPTFTNVLNRSDSVTEQVHARARIKRERKKEGQETSLTRIVPIIRT